MLLPSSMFAARLRFKLIEDKDFARFLDSLLDTQHLEWSATEQMLNNYMLSKRCPPTGILRTWALQLCPCDVGP